ncbi:MAG: peroxiredoxin [Candidatus Lernaella stagnicola]|nr:peroxiredoxin [Candidatus Lernaella stagnicola]
MTQIEVGKKAPNFELPDANGKQVRLSDFHGKKVVLYFYLKDNTSGCTKEACSFRDHSGAFHRRGAVIIGISPDSEKSHQKFIENFDLPFTLLADTERRAAESYGVWKKKGMSGKKDMGVERSTFIIDETGILIEEHREVSVPGHVEAMLSAITG